MYEKYRDQGVLFIGLTGEERSSLSDIRQFVNETGISWPNGYGAQETLARFQNSYLPQAWVVGPDGRVVWNQAAEGNLEDGIEKALALRNGSQATRIED